MIVHDTFDIYKARKGFINPSSFKGDKIKTPAVFEYEYGRKTEESDAMKMGSAIHCLILTPELFPKEYHICKDADFPGKRTTKDAISFAATEKGNKEALAIIVSENPGKKILMPQEADIILGMKGGLDRFLMPEYRINLDLRYGVVETSIYFAAKFDQEFNFIEFCESPVGYPENITCPYFKHEGFHYLYIKTRSDYFSKVKTYASDLKSCRCAEPESFSKDVYEYGYHIQGAITVDLLNAHFTLGYKEVCQMGYSRFYFIVVENTAPFQAIRYLLSEPATHRGRESYINRLSWICKGYALNNWPGYEIYSDSINFDKDDNITRNYKTKSIDLPHWAYQKEERKQKREEIRGFKDESNRSKTTCHRLPF